MKTPRGIISLILFIVIIALAATASTYMISTREKPKAVPNVQPVWLVSVTKIKPINSQIMIEGEGTVNAKNATDVIPQVSGKVIKVHPELNAGGTIPKNEPFIEIEPTDYEIALKTVEAEIKSLNASISAAQADIAQAKTDLEDKKDERDRTQKLLENNVANQREYDKARRAYEISRAKLQSAEARLESTVASLNAAEVNREQALVNLERTKVTLPYDAIVVSESVDVGMYILVSQKIAHVYQRSTFEIPVPLTDDELKWLNLEGVISPESNKPKPNVTVSGQYAGIRCEWEGKVARIANEVDQRTRMQKLIIEVKDTDPQNIKRLVPGMFTTVKIQGRMLDNIFRIARNALRDNDTVWLMKDNKLIIQPVEVLRKTDKEMLIGQGLTAGDQIIISSLEAVSNGMKVRTQTEANSDE